MRCSAIVPSDLVLECVKAFKGKHNVSDQWENMPYVVMKWIRDDLPVYEFRQKDHNQQSQILY